MSRIDQLINAHIDTASNRIFIREQGGTDYTLYQLRDEANMIASRLAELYGDCQGLIFGIAMRSSCYWISTMMAIGQLRAVLLPVPLEFSDEQISNLLGKATAIFVSNGMSAERIHSILPDVTCIDARLPESWDIPFPNIQERIEPGICAIIHTSGTTSKPKGVKIRAEALGVLVRNVLERVPSKPLHYMSIVPMSLLIEQVLGVYLPLLSGGSVTLMPEGVAEYGSRSGNAKDYLQFVAKAHPNFLYLPPKILEEANDLLTTRSPESLFGKNKPHIITGGAKIAWKVLEELDTRDIHIFEAYGLSESSPIISLNYHGNRRIGSVGPLLDGIEPKLVDGELLVRTPTLCAGYYNADDTSCELSDGYLHTGDIAEIRDGFLYITGRKKHVIILSTARNISPEWVESVYRESSSIDDIIVMGDGRDELATLVLSRASLETVRNEMAKLDYKLANFARINRIRIVEDVDSFRSHYYTVTGRPMRKKIEMDFIESLYP